MGQKTHPYGFRLNVIRTWSSKWFEDKHYSRWLHEDLQLREAIKKKFANAGIAGISLERAASKAKVVIATSRPGIIIGRRGAGVEQLKEELQKLTENELFIDIQEVRKAETNAQLVAENIATQLERRVAGRLGGSEIARDEKYREGRVPLHTLRADIDYGTAVARTTAGSIGIKVWIFKGEVLQQRRRPGMPGQPLPR
jgi:small subunit ribosomal protein S3